MLSHPPDPPLVCLQSFLELAGGRPADVRDVRCLRNERLDQLPTEHLMGACG